MKTDLPFFSHNNNARRHPKMKALIAEFGFEGYGRFWVLCERVAESSNARVDISKKVNKLDLAAELGLDGNGLDKFLAFLADPEIDLINLEDGVITVDRISERFTEVTKDREDARDRKARKKEKPESSGEPCESSDGKGESSGELSKKENKRKESKVNESKEEESSASFSQSQKDAFELSEPPDPQSFSTASAAAFQGRVETGLIPAKSRSPPEKANKTELTREQLALYHSAKACFETSGKAKALMYQDKESTARELKHLKTIVVRCCKIAPGMTAGFLLNVLEAFKAMCNGKYAGRWVFTPQTLITSWIWGLVIDSLPEAESHEALELRKKIKGMFDDD